MSESAYARSRRDQAAADGVPERTALDCSAAGCPRRWSVDGGGGKLCSAHAWVSPGLWPRVTQELLDADADAARATAAPRSPPRHVSRDERLAVLEALRGVVARGTAARQWAVRLQQREQAGERLSGPQRSAWRVALYLDEDAAA